MPPPAPTPPPHLGCVHLLIIVKPWLVFACQWKGFTHRPIGCKDWLPPSWEINSAKSRTCFSIALVPLSQPLECATFGGGGWVVLWCDLVHSGSWEVQAKVSCYLCPAWAPSSPPYELQCHLLMAATYTGLTGTQERPICNPRPANTNAGPGTT